MSVLPSSWGHRCSQDVGSASPKKTVGLYSVMVVVGAGGAEHQDGLLRRSFDDENLAWDQLPRSRLYLQMSQLWCAKSWCI